MTEPAFLIKLDGLTEGPATARIDWRGERPPGVVRRWLMLRKIDDLTRQISELTMIRQACRKEMDE